MRQNFYLLVVDVPVRIVLIYLAAPFGLEAVGISFIVVSLIDNIICILQCHIVLSANLKEIVKELYKSAAVTVAASILPLLVFLFGDGFLAEKLWLQLFIGMTAAMLGWFAGLFWFRHPLRVEIGNSFVILKQSIGMLLKAS